MEILAPAGTIESLKAAVIAGADAVYFGLGELNARAKSIDFNESNLSVWVDYCHLYGVKAYITINVNIYDHELERAIELVTLCYNSKVDALIVSDLGLVVKIRELFPDFPVHVSTQAGVKNKSASEFYKALGATRVVLSREISLSDIDSIDGIEKEIFVHGALCVAFSGNCLLSCFIGGKSGNRGQCRQPCRQLYTAFDTKGNKLKEGYLLSAKDISLDESIAELIAKNVDSLKIEGRLKSPEYVYAVTSYYRKLIDGVKADKKDVLLTFNRGGFTNGYFNGKNVIYTKTSSHIGIPVGKVLKIENKKGFSFATIDVELQKGDGVKVVRKGIEVGGSDVTSCVKTNDNWVIPVSSGVCLGDTICLTKSTALTRIVNLAKRLIPVNFNLEFTAEYSKLTAEYNGIKASVLGEKPTELRDLTFDEVLSQLSKTGGTNFELNSLNFSGNGYLPKSALNKLRSSVLIELEKVIAQNYEPQRVDLNDISDFRLNCYTEKINGTVVESDFLDVNLTNISALVYYPKFISLKAYQKAVELTKTKGIKLFIKFPTLIKEEELNEYIDFAVENNVGIYANNISVVHLARQNKVPYIAGVELNIANKVTESMYKDSALTLMSLELGNHKISDDCYIYSYGRIPLMTFEHCPNYVCTGLDCDKCIKKAQNLIYKHEQDKYLLVGVRAKHRCYYTMFSDKKLDIKNKDNKKYINTIGDDIIPTFDGLIGE